MRHAKMAYEPQRYHFVMFEHLYKAMTAADYKTDILNQGLPVEDDKKDKKKNKDKKDKKEKKAKSVASEDEKPEKDNKSDKKSKSSSSSKSSGSSSDSDSDGSLCNSEREHRKLKKRDKKNSKMTFHQTKHVFSIDIKQLKNIPVLTKFIKDAKDLQAATMRTNH